MCHTLTPVVGVCDGGRCVAAGKIACCHTVGTHTDISEAGGRVARLRKFFVIFAKGKIRHPSEEGWRFVCYEAIIYFTRRYVPVRFAVGDSTGDGQRGA